MCATDVLAALLPFLARFILAFSCIQFVIVLACSVFSPLCYNSLIIYLPFSPGLVLLVLLLLLLRTYVDELVEQVNKRAQNALDMLEDTHWPIGAQVKLGAALIKLLIETACWTHDEERGVVRAWDKGANRVGGRGGAEGVPIPQAAFIHTVVKSKKSKQGNLYLAPEVFSKVGRCSARCLSEC